MENEEIFINRHQLKVLQQILQHISESLNDCHYLTNIKGGEFNHRLSGFEHFIQSTQIQIAFSKGFISEKLITDTITTLETFLSVFTCGGHRLELKLFNELFFQKRLITELYKVMYSDPNN